MRNAVIIGLIVFVIVAAIDVWIAASHEVSVWHAEVFVEAGIFGVIGFMLALLVRPREKRR